MQKPILRGALFASLVLTLAPFAHAEEQAAKPASSPEIEAARAFAFAAMPGQCDDRTEEADQPFADNVYPLKWRYSYEDETTPEHEVKLFEIFCMAGPYNVNDVYVLKDEEGQLSLVSFAEPQFDLEYADDDNDTYTKLKAPPRVTGYGTTNYLTNAEFDPKTSTLSDFAKWRGIGDAWSAGTWVFKEGEFVLSSYEIDPIYEANLDNPPDGIGDKSFKLFP